MSQAFDIQISGDLVAQIPRLKDPAGHSRAIAREMDYQNQLTVARIQAGHLSGPTTDSSLSVRTNRLRGSAKANRSESEQTGPAVGKSIIMGNQVVSSIGSNVVYARIHEFGGVIQRTVKAGSVKLRTNKQGQLFLRGKLATFANRKHKLFKTVQFAGGKSYTITIPARAPFGHGIADRLPEYTAAFEAVTAEYLGGAN